MWELGWVVWACWKPRLGFYSSGGVLVAGVLSCVSAETRGFKLAPRGFCSLGVVLRGVTGSWNTWIRIGPENKVQLSTSAKHGFRFWGHPQVLVSDGNQA